MMEMCGSGACSGLSHGGGHGAPGASQQLLSELPWEKKHEISLQKPRNGKTLLCKCKALFLGGQGGLKLPLPSTPSPPGREEGLGKHLGQPGAGSSTALCKPQWGMSQGPAPAGQCIPGFLSTKPNLRPAPHTSPGLEGAQNPGQQCQEHQRVAQPTQRYQHLCWLHVGMRGPKG